MVFIRRNFRLHPRSSRVYSLPSEVEAGGAGSNVPAAPPPDYKTTIVDTGQKWRDGRSILRKIIGFGALPGAAITITFPHGITNPQSILHAWGIGTTTDAGGQYTPISNGTTAALGAQITCDETDVIILAFDDLTAFDDSYVYLDYVAGQPI